MLRSLGRTLLQPSGLSCIQSRGIRAKPVYYNPADVDETEDHKFNEDFGITEPKPPVDRLASRNDPFAWIVDPYYKMKAYVGKFLGSALHYRQTPEEISEREVLNERLHAFYSTIPQQYPDAEWWNDVIDHYVRYNDFDGAQKMWYWLKDFEIDVDKALLDKFERFFYENDPVSLFQKSIPAQLREQTEYWPEKPPCNLLRVGEHGIEDPGACN